MSAVLDVVRLVDGGQPRLIPQPKRPVKLGPLRYVYRNEDLEPAVRELYINITLPSGKIQTSVIALAGFYIDGLRAILRSAEREHRFRKTTDDA